CPGCCPCHSPARPAVRTRQLIQSNVWRSLASERQCIYDPAGSTLRFAGLNILQLLIIRWLITLELGVASALPLVSSEADPSGWYLDRRLEPCCSPSVKTSRTA